MIECIFTIDYEIYGNGDGSLIDLVYEPAQRLKEIFLEQDMRFVVFIEVAEIEVIEAKGADPAIESVKKQIVEFHREGFEIGLHLHPQWYNASHENGRWVLDYNEYNLCVLPQERIVQIVERSISYLQNVLGISDFIPLSFRAGNWLFQPTKGLSSVLAERGIRIDSSVFKGGVQYQHRLDYRQALRNGYYWRFMENINVSEPKGTLIELPIYTQMVPPWRMLTNKRIAMNQKSLKKDKKRLNRFRDFFRFRYPLKLDFCSMTINELTRMIDKLIREDKQDYASFRPVVAIGHTKDLSDFETIKLFMAYLKNKEIMVSTFENVEKKCFP